MYNGEDESATSYRNSELLSLVLEHMTGAGTLVELYCALLPIYCWIMLL